MPSRRQILLGILGSGVLATPVSADTERQNIEIEDAAFPDSVRIGQSFTASIDYRNPSSETVEVTLEYKLCVNTPEEASERGNSCYRVLEVSKTVEPESGWNTTLSPVIDSDVPEEYRIPGERGQEISIRTDSDRVLGAAITDSLELLPRYNPTEQATEENPPATTKATPRETDSQIETTEMRPQTESDPESDTADSQGLVSPAVRDILTIMSAAGITFAGIYRYLFK